MRSGSRRSGRQGVLGYLLITSLLLLSACGLSSTTPPDQRQPLVSPSGEYVLTLPIEAKADDPDLRVWTVTIFDAEGRVLYRDPASEFVGNLNVYWRWDAEDRVWLYSSDTGAVFFWENVEGAWVKMRWGYGREREIERDVTPPPGLYPPYVDD